MEECTSLASLDMFWDFSLKIIKAEPLRITHHKKSLFGGYLRQKKMSNIPKLFKVI